MDKLTAIKIKYNDQSYSDEIPVGALAENIEWDNTHSMVDILGDVDTDLSIQDQISQLFNEKVSESAMQNYVTNSMPSYITNWLNQHITNIDSTVALDDTLSTQGAAADAKATGDAIENVESDIADLKDDLTDIVDYWGDTIAPYLYKRNCYINGNMEETTLNGYDLYKVPVEAGDLAVINQIASDEMFYGSISISYVLRYLTTDGYSPIAPGASSSNHPKYLFDISRPTLTERGYKGLIESGTTALMFSVKNGNENKLSLSVNKRNIALNDPDKLEYINAVYELDEANSIKSQIYSRSSGMVTIYTAGYSIRTHSLKKGDKVVFSAMTTGTNLYGFFINSTTLATENVSTAEFTATEDGYIEYVYYTNDPITVTVYPSESIKLDWSAIKNVPNSPTPYLGLSGVAFGTSLTYRAQTTGGYLQYLPNLAEMTFDNQGIGSSTILGNMLTAIKAYTSYSDKDVCILEGFVNDWYQGLTLGTYKDTIETTVCGCVRSALDYMLSQNANLTIFLVLDHYGKLYGGVDCRSIAENSNGVTQYEFYEEIAKVAQSLGIPVIKLYADSQISQNTPQYLSDNIHPTALGAKQDAYTIWAGMKQHYPNQVN